MSALHGPLLLALAMAVLGGLVALGRAIGPALGLQRIGLPAALVAGVLGLLLGPYGPWPVLPAPVETLWARLPMVLLTFVFGTLMLGRPLPDLAKLWKPAAAQTLLGLTLGFGQYLVGAVAVLLVLGPWLGADPLMACLIEVGFEGGHGSAAVMGPIYADLGFSGGTDLGLAMATVGLLSSTVVGGLLVVLAQGQGWLLAAEAGAPLCVLPEPAATAVAAVPGWQERLRQLATNLALVGIAVGIGVVMLAGLERLAEPAGGMLRTVIDALPVYPLALAGSLLVRLALERSDRAELAVPALQNGLGALATDLLIAAATAGLNLPLLRANWLPLLVLSGFGLAWNLLVILVLAPRILPAGWFERAVIEFGQATGVAASGLLLLGMADPDGRSEAIPAFSIKQLLLQPVLAGGVVTVAAPLALHSWGLPLWGGVCLGLTVLWGGLALALGAGRP
ncbi:sodium:solute symporter [Cyanobium sp. Aljojuca 7D2]|uniref:sodium/glutamate symporter n=1 Tax=Cyanobium sp. Aljojuca 7D2 TaxID=2823698 RepID=UPI0020CD3B81|nr:sodium:solute symporter [Cyanobium sp. Aljojuca 7D2]MCP9891590.1 sodium:solute symporter [Cyanobium sp. Aljojuca 7D2]